MPSFGTQSTARLSTVDEGLRDVCYRVIPVLDFTVIWGMRGEDAQNRCYREGTSTKPWPESLHNAVLPSLSMAVDIAPWFSERPHIRWNHEREFVKLAGHMMQAAHELGVELRWGGDWDQDQDLYDRNVPFDLGHFERLHRRVGEVK